LQNRILSC